MRLLCVPQIALTAGFLPPEYRCHVYVRSDSLACVVIADQEYPPRVVFTLMSKVILRANGVGLEEK